MPTRIRRPRTPPPVPPRHVCIAGFTIVGEWDTPNWYRSWYDPARQEMRRETLGTDDFDEAEQELIRRIHKEFQDPDALCGDPLVTSVMDGYRNDPSFRWKEFRGFPTARAYAEENWQGVTVRKLTKGLRKAFVRHHAALGHAPAYISNLLGHVARAVRWSGEADDDDRVLCPDPPSIIYGTNWVCGVLNNRELPEPVNYHPEPHEMAEVIREIARDENGRRWALNALFTAGRPNIVRLLGPEALKTRFGQTVVDLHPPGRRRSKKRHPCLPVPETILAEWRAWDGDPWVPRGHTWMEKAVARAAEACGLPMLLPSSFRDYMATAIRHAHIHLGAERVMEDDAQRWMGHREAPILDASRARGVHARYGIFYPEYLDVPMRAAEAVVLDLDRRAGCVLFRHANPHRSRQVSAKRPVGRASATASVEGKSGTRAAGRGVIGLDTRRGSPRAALDLDAVKTGKMVEIGGIRGSFRQLSAKPAVTLDEAFERKPSDILSSRSASRMLFVPAEGSEGGETLIIVTGDGS